MSFNLIIMNIVYLTALFVGVSAKVCEIQGVHITLGDYFVDKSAPVLY